MKRISAYQSDDGLVQKVVELQSKINKLKALIECLNQEIAGEDW